MPVNVDQVTSEVVAEPGAAAAPSGGSGPGQESPWLALARHQALGALSAEDALRTRAEAYDD
jgi:hypothetical protein